MKNFPTNLTDNQYDTILRIIGDNRKRQHSFRSVLDAIFYLLKAGCQWRMLPPDFPNWERVYCYFQKGLLLGIKVHAANEHDSRSALRVLERLKGRFERLKKIYADGGYGGELLDKVKDRLNCEMEITLRTDKSTAFKPLPKRWVVERSLA